VRRDVIEGQRRRLQDFAPARIEAQLKRQLAAVGVS
jgi:hypothetical protein